MTPRVLLVSNFLSDSRTPCVAEALAVRLRARHWSVLTTSSQQNKALRLLDMVQTIWRRRHEYDVAQVDVYGTLAFVFAEVSCAALRLAGKPYVLTLHGGTLPDRGRRSPRRMRRLLRSAAAVTVPSRYLLERMAPYRQDLTLLPNAIDVPASGHRTRRRIAPRLVWIRSFHRLYNPCLAVHTLRLLSRDVADARLTMLGPDKGDGSLAETEQLARSEGLSSRVELPGRCDKRDVPRWLESGDIFLNTANADNAPVSVLEAMASGLCVVSTNVGGMPYLLEHERDALLVPPDDPGAMAAAVRRLLAEPELAETISVGARRKAEQCDWPRVLDEWQHILDAAANRRDRPRTEQRQDASASPARDAAEPPFAI